MPDPAPPPCPLRLLFVGTNRGPGGAESYWIALARALARAGHTVAAVAAPDDVIWHGLAADGRIALFPAEFRTKFDRAAVNAVRAAARATRPDWLLCNYKREYWGALAAGRACGVPVALFRHHAELKPWLAHVVGRLADRFVVPSAFLRDWVVARGVPAARAVVVPNAFDFAPLDAARAERAEARAALGVGEGDVVAAFLGRFDHNKGVLVLADAFARAMDTEPRLHALWAGRGHLAEAIDSAGAGTPHAARHHRIAWTPDVGPVYAAADLVVLPSLWEEAFGRVLVEAQAAGLPVVASDVGGVREAVRAGASALLVPRGDAGVLADAVLALAADPARRVRMGAAGRAFARATFDGSVVAAECARILTGGG